VPWGADVGMQAGALCGPSPVPGRTKQGALALAGASMGLTPGQWGGSRSGADCTAVHCAQAPSRGEGADGFAVEGVELDGKGYVGVRSGAGFTRGFGMGLPLPHTPAPEPTVSATVLTC
jgi:hypothetical protein